MARTTKDFAISTPTARGRLEARSEPYYRSVQQGLALGYRRGRKGGTWVARMRLPEQSSYGETKLGAADDGGAVADGAAVLSYDSAVKAAREAFAAAEARRVSGTLPSAAKATVDDVLDLYRKAYLAGDTRRGKGPGRDIDNVDSIFKCHLRPRLGSIRLDRMNSARLKAFKVEIVEAPRLTRSGKPVEPDPEDEEFEEAEALRKRKARANRIMTVLRAALNHAKAKGWFASDAAWREALVPYPHVDVASMRYLEIDECDRLKASVEEDFRNLGHRLIKREAKFATMRAVSMRGSCRRACRSAWPLRGSA